MTVVQSTPESSLLLTLSEISQLVSHSHDPHETLTNIVRLIQDRFHTAVCSVYLLEADRMELVLGATIGLKPECVGRVRMRLNEGLTGLVAEKMTHVMVEDAFQHPRFKYFPEAGEDLYHSFLGVPLLAGGALQGVLVVQTAAARAFSSNEIRMLVTVGSQLAPVVSDARLMERIVQSAHSGGAPAHPALANGPTHWRGAPLSPGIGTGLAYILNGFSDWLREVPQYAADPVHEKERLSAALAAALAELTRQSEHISALVGEDHGIILQAQMMIMQDRAVEQDLHAYLEAGHTAEGALTATLDKYIAAFQKVASPFFQERIYDIKDVFRRLLWHLRPSVEAPGGGTDRLVLLAHEASVMDLFSVDPARLAAVVVEHGGTQSHAAILARSLGIPMVGQIHDLIGQIEPGRPVFVDATTGMVHLDPTPAQIHRCVQASTATLAAEPCVLARTPSRAGIPRLEANINLLSETGRAVELQAEGVGLFRTEFLFLARRTLPTEEEQVGVYHKLLARLQGRPVSIRTFDLRPDKVAHQGTWNAAGNHPFDWRLVLESPPIQQLFKDQVRAILRAAARGPARILIPLVTRTEQLDFVIETVQKARAELRREGLEFGEEVPLGVMLEVAAAAALTDLWADQVDFFALGTNDLTASTLGVDRDDPVAASLSDPLHPGLLRLTAEVVRAAHAAGRRVTVCGEMAASPEGAGALTALGVDSLSVAVGQLDSVRQFLADLNLAVINSLPTILNRFRTADQVRHFLRQASQRESASFSPAGRSSEVPALQPRSPSALFSPLE